MEDQENDEELDEPDKIQELRELNLIDSYSLGLHLTYLKQAAFTGDVIGERGNRGVLHHLSRLEEILAATGFAESISPQVEEMIFEIEEEHSEDSADTPLSNNLSETLEKYTDAWSQLIIEELRNERRIKVPNSGVIDLEMLMDNPSVLFQPETWDKMDEMPKQDIREACTTLPLNCTTSTVFISLRAVEHYLKEWFEHKEDKELSNPTWGSVLDELFREYSKETPDSAPVMEKLSKVPDVLSNLHYLKQRRDRVSHSESSPSGYEAAITLFMVAGTITEIIEEIEDE